MLPAAVRYQTELAQNVAALKAAGVEADTSALTDVTTPITTLRSALATLKAALEHEGGDDALAHATYSTISLPRPGASVCGARRHERSELFAETGSKRHRPHEASSMLRTTA